MNFYFRWIRFLSALAPYDGSYWGGLITDEDEPPAAESPTREEITAARQVIPIVPRPPVTANTPAREREPSRKTGTSGKKHAKAESPAKQRTGAVPAPVASDKTPKGKRASVPIERKPAPPRREPPPKSAAERAQAPIATMAELEASLAASSRDDERSLAEDAKTPATAEGKAPVTTAPASEQKPPEALPRRCRVHQRRANPPPVRACLLCRLAAAKA